MEEFNEVRYYRTGAISNSSLPLDKEIRLMKTLSRRIEEIIEIEKPDILHAHSPVLNAIPAVRLGRKLRIPVVYEIRAFWEDAAVNHGTYRQNSLKFRLVRSCET